MTGEGALFYFLSHMKNMEKEEIDYTIKQRLEIVKIEEKQKEALKELDNLIKKIDEQNLRLQVIKGTEEKCLTEIEREAEERVGMAMLKLRKAGRVMAELEQKAILTVTEIKDRSKRVQDTILGLLGRAKELVENSDSLKESSEGVMKSILKAQTNLEEKIKNNSEFESILKTREKEVKIKSQKADQKLKEAKDLAYWHKDPEARYPGK